MDNIEKDVIDLGKVAKKIWASKRKFFIMWPIVFALSCLWVLPKPRYYKCDIMLAPEATGEAMGGGLASIASNFGFDLGAGGSDAIYPLLYPDLMSSNEFICDILKVKVTTEDKSVSTDYYTYLRKHQQKNWLTEPFNKAKSAIVALFTEKKPAGKGNPSQLDPFFLSEKDFELVESVKQKITCSVDKKSDVITINVEDQDRYVCATLADSVRLRLQEFIIKYRTSKSRLDVEHYQHLADSAKQVYDKSVLKYSAYCDANQDILLQSSISERDNLESDMQLKYNTYTAMQAQLETMKAKLQERTPAFTVIQGASVPQLPAGPKRMINILIFMVFTAVMTGLYVCRDLIANEFRSE